MAERYTQVPRATLWLVEGGDFVMGPGQGATGGATEAGSGSSFPLEIGSLYIGKSAITNEQFEAYAPSYERSPLSPEKDHPAVGVSFHDAVGYCDWYARLSKKRFRLPTEAEWEFICRGGTRTRYFFGDDPAAANPYVWHRDNSGGHCHEAESTRANPFGVHEMLGSVWEWTASLYQPYPVRAGDGRDELTESNKADARVLRGGSYRTALSEMGSSVRRAEKPEARLDDVGFRIVRSL